MKHFTLATAAGLGLLAAAPALAQNELSNFSATGRGGVINTFALDYQSLGINPANLGRSTNSRVAFTVGEVGAGAASRSLSNSTFRKLLFNPDQPLTAAQRSDLVTTLTSDNTLNINIDVNAAALAFKLPSRLGGVAVSYRQRLAGHLALNRNAADIIVNGNDAAIVRQYYTTSGSSNGTPPPKLSAALDGTALQLAWTAEYNIGYGVEVLKIPGVLTLSAGAGYRYIQGIGIADMRIADGGLYAYSALSPVFKINYGSAGNSSNFNRVTGDGLESVGHGNGFDLGLAAEIGKVLRLGASVTDLGSMTWTGNVLTATDQNLNYPQYTGLTTYNVVQNIINQFGNDQKTLFTYQPSQERKANLPAKLRMGGGVRISELFEAGLDVTVPLNNVAGNLPSTFVGAGVDFKPKHWVRLSTGVSGGAGYGISLPLGVTFTTKLWDAGISTRNVLGYFSENNPYYSAAVGVLRFHIGVGEEK